MSETKQESLLGMFGMEEEPAPVIIKKGAEKKNGANHDGRKKKDTEAGDNKSKATPAKKKEDKLKPVGKPVNVRLYGESIEFTDPKLTLEDIRKELEKDYPELTKDVTVMHYDKPKGIVVPVVSLKPKG